MLTIGRHCYCSAGKHVFVQAAGLGAVGDGLYQTALHSKITNAHNCCTSLLLLLLLLSALCRHLLLSVEAPTLAAAGVSTGPGSSLQADTFSPSVATRVVSPMLQQVAA
jgi:hypothetical protein